MIHSLGIIAKGGVFDYTFTDICNVFDNGMSKTVGGLYIWVPYH